MFQGFPEIKEALISGRIQAGFIVAPMAMALRSQGVPIKVVYLGHRYGSAVVVRRDGPVRSIADLSGRTIAVPSRFSDERLILHKVFADAGLPQAGLKIVEMPPPDVAGALAAGAIDGFSMGEPYPSQAEMAGFGRILFRAAEHWPDYMSCVLVVRQEVIDARPEAVQVLVDGIARSGLWLDEGPPHREQAARFVARDYFHQPEALLRYALTTPLDRVLYAPLSPRRKDFELVRDLMVATGLLDPAAGRSLDYHDYVDERFAERASVLTSWRFDDEAPDEPAPPTR